MSCKYFYPTSSRDRLQFRRKNDQSCYSGNEREKQNYKTKKKVDLCVKHFVEGFVACNTQPWFLCSGFTIQF